MPDGVLIALHLATYVAAGIAVWANRAPPGLLVIGAGALMNGVTIAAVLIHGVTRTIPARAVQRFVEGRPAAAGSYA